MFGDWKKIKKLMSVFWYLTVYIFGIFPIFHKGSFLAPFRKWKCFLTVEFVTLVCVCMVYNIICASIIRLLFNCLCMA